jgi:hypothetical protein
LPPPPPPPGTGNGTGDGNDNSSGSGDGDNTFIPTGEIFEDICCKKENSCYETDSEQCGVLGGTMLHEGFCIHNDNCTRIYPCYGSDTKECAEGNGIMSCTEYHTWGNCVIVNMDYNEAFDRDRDEDPDDTDCDDFNNLSAASWPEICSDGIDNNCNNRIDEAGCMDYEDAYSQGLIPGYAFKAAEGLSFMQVLKGALFVVALGVIIAFIYRREKKKIFQT